MAESSFQQPVILCMAPNPKPDHGTAFENAEYSVIAAHADGIDRLYIVNSLEA
jgi:hypothetical protein